MGLFLLALSLVGVVYNVASCFAVRWLFSRPEAPARQSPSVTVLKPLCGDEPGLAARLEELCRQDYVGPVQIIFGVRDPLDPAVKVVEKLIQKHSRLDIQLVVDERILGLNLKISNLINMARVARYDTFVVADSDVSVSPDYLTHLMAALDLPNVGYATCFYFGLPAGNIWSKISAMSVNYNLLPSVALGLRLKMAKPCFGPTMAFRRDILNRAGGFDAFVNRLADDFEIGKAIRDLGYTFAVSARAIGHQCPETSGGGVFAHELRWARTIRLVEAAGYAGTAICHPLLFALLGALLLRGSVAGLAILFVVIASKLLLIRQVDRFSPIKVGVWWLSPFRDLLSAAVFIASFMGSRVTWRGRQLRIAPGGDLAIAGHRRDRLFRPGRSRPRLIRGAINQTPGASRQALP
jgi:ceramide glucosyltransferase